MAISDDLNSIRTHLEDDYTALEQLGVSVEDRNIENIKDMANQIYAKFPKTSYAEGSNITLSNTLKGKLDFEKIYQEVEYITNTNGTEYINTDFMPNQDTRLVLDFENQTTIASFICGGRNSAGLNSFGLLVASDTAFRSDYANNLGVITIPSTLGRFIIDKNKNITTITKNGEVIGSYNDNYTVFAPNQNFYLFNTNNNGATSSPVALIKLYSCKIFDNDVLVRDFIPCYRKSDGVIGLYDKVEGKFYTNVGTGTFTKGADVGSGFGDILGIGDTSQKSYEGYNLLPSVNTTRTINGVTFTHNADGSITANGTASANALYPINVDGTSVTRNVSLVAGSYVIVDSVGDYTNYFCQLSDGTNFANTGSGGAVGKSNTITLSSQANVSALVYIRSGVTINNVTFKPMVVTSSNIDKSYEPYVGGIASPNPSYPQEVEVVRGKNLFDKDNANILNANLVSFTNISTNSPSNRTLYIPIKPNTTYTISKIKTSFFVIGTTTDTPTINMPYSQRLDKSNTTSATITTSETAKYLIVWYYNSGSDTGVTEQEILDSVQIEKGSQATSYLPYNTIEVVERGKNLFNPDIASLLQIRCNVALDKDKILVTAIENGDIYVGNVTNVGSSYESNKGVKIPVKPLTTYTFSSTNSNINKIFITEYDSNDVSLGYIQNVKVTTKSNTKYITIRYGLENAVNGTTYETYLQIETGSTATTYEPYQTPQSYQLSLGEYEFAKIGNYVDTIEYDVDEDKVYKNEAINKYQFTGNENFGKAGSTNLNGYIFNFPSVTTNILPPANNGTKANILSNAFITKAVDTIISEATYGIGIRSDKYLYIGAPLGSFENVSALQTYLANNITFMYYTLITPVKKEITGTLKDQIKALYNSQSFTGTTIIEIDGQLPLIIKVRALKGE